jgi:hypothetical protein
VSALEQLPCQIVPIQVESVVFVGLQKSAESLAEAFRSTPNNAAFLGSWPRGMGAPGVRSKRLVPASTHSASLGSARIHG